MLAEVEATRRSQQQGFTGAESRLGSLGCGPQGGRGRPEGKGIDREISTGAGPQLQLVHGGIGATEHQFHRASGRQRHAAAVVQQQTLGLQIAAAHVDGKGSEVFQALQQAHRADTVDGDLSLGGGRSFGEAHAHRPVGFQIVGVVILKACNRGGFGVVRLFAQPAATGGPVANSGHRISGGALRIGQRIGGGGTTRSAPGRGCGWRRLQPLARQEGRTIGEHLGAVGVAAVFAKGIAVKTDQIERPFFIRRHHSAGLALPFAPAIGEAHSRLVGATQGGERTTAGGALGTHRINTDIGLVIKPGCRIECGCRCGDLVTIQTEYSALNRLLQDHRQETHLVPACEINGRRGGLVGSERNRRIADANHLVDSAAGKPTNG